MPRRACNACACRLPRHDRDWLSPVLLACVLLAAPHLPAQRKAPARETATPAIATESLPALLQRGAQAFSAGDFAQAAEAFGQVEREFGGETEWRAGALPRRVLPLRGFAELRAGRAEAAAASLAAFLERFPEDAAQRGFALYALAVALQAAGRAGEALARFAEYEVLHPGSAQAALSRIQRADILFDAGRTDEALALLEALAADEAAADSLRTRARLRALEQATALGRDDTAVALLLGRPWNVDTMPEIAVLAFTAMEIGDRLLGAGRAAEAALAFRLVPPRGRLIAAQRLRLDELRRLLAERAPAAAADGGAFWVDFYQARAARIEAQLAALETADDHTWPLRLRLGQAMLLAGRAREAWLCFESVVAAADAGDELRREAHYRWILAAGELGEWPAAREIARRFVDDHPASDLAPEAFFLIARAHLEQQQWPEAEAVLGDILARFPAHPAAARSRFTRGWVRAMRDEHEAARADFEACIAAAPGTGLAAEAGVWRGLTHHFAREYRRALEVFDALAREHAGRPIHPEILYRRAATLHAMREPVRARAELEAFVSNHSMHQRYPEALVLLGDVLMGLGELEEALGRFAAVPGTAADAFVHATFQTGKILRARGDHAGMVAHFSGYVGRAAVGGLPRVSEALHHLGWAEEQRGRPGAALPHYLAVLADHGNDPGAGEVSATLAALQRLSRRIARDTAAGPAGLEDLGRLVSGDYEGWLRETRERALDEGRDTWHARLTLALADLHRTRREPAQAEALILGLASAVPREALDAPALARLGAALQAIGAGEAVECFQRLLAAYPKSTDRAAAFHGLALDALRLDRPAEALAWADRVGLELPSHPLAADAALTAGEALERAGRHAEAAERYEELLRLRSARGRPHARALAGLARCARIARDLPRAIACYQRVYTLYRAQHDIAAEAYLGSAPLFEALGDLPAAAATYREMLASPGVGDTVQREEAQRALDELERRLAVPLASATP